MAAQHYMRKWELTQEERREWRRRVLSKRNLRLSRRAKNVIATV